MPYRSTAALPAPVKATLTKKGQEVFLATFNAAAKDGKAESSCMAIAYAAAKRAGGYKKARA